MLSDDTKSSFLLGFFFKLKHDCSLETRPQVECTKTRRLTRRVVRLSAVDSLELPKLNRATARG